MKDKEILKEVDNMDARIGNELFKEVEEKARKNLIGIISLNKLGYTKQLHLEMKRIFNEMGIEWNPKDYSTSID